MSHDIQRIGEKLFTSTVPSSGSVAIDELLAGSFRNVLSALVVRRVGEKIKSFETQRKVVEVCTELVCGIANEASKFCDDDAHLRQSCKLMAVAIEEICDGKHDGQLGILD